MEITVNESAQCFQLAYEDHWKSAVGHEIKVGKYRFCAIPLRNSINVSEITSGTKVFEVDLAPEIIFMTGAKGSAMKFFEGLGGALKEIINSANNFDESLAAIRKEAIERLGKALPVGDVDPRMFEYHPCIECGIFADDGSFLEGAYFCHDCLDLKEKSTLAIQCGYDMPWAGLCKKKVMPGSEVCENHSVACVVCKNTLATHGCTHASSLSCGAPLCNAKKCRDKHSNIH